MKFWMLPVAALLVLAAFTFQKSAAPTKACVSCDQLTGTAKLICLADELKATLSPAQIATLQLDYSFANAQKWSNLPVTFVPRLGIRFGDLNATQLAAAKALVQAAMGTKLPEGYEELKQLWAADQYLLNNGGGSAYGEGQYYLAFLGTPSLTGSWELQTGGHHAGVSNTYSNGQLIGATPSFRGVEPFAAFANGTETYQPMLQERDALAAMLAALSTSELASAKLTTSFSDISLGPNKDWQFPTIKSGIKVGTLSSAQKALVLAAIKTYVEDIDDENAAKIMTLYTAGLDDTYIAYSGNANLLNQKDYVRIDGPRVWIEYNTQNGIVLTPKHPHSVWRDHLSDYGGLGNPASGTNMANQFNGKFQLTPNPASSSASAELELDQSALVSINIFDMTGKKMSAGLKINVTTGKHSLPLDIQSLPKGIYNCVLEIRTSDGFSFATRQLSKL